MKWYNKIGIVMLVLILLTVPTAVLWPMAHKEALLFPLLLSVIGISVVLIIKE